MLQKGSTMFHFIARESIYFRTNITSVNKEKTGKRKQISKLKIEYAIREKKITSSVYTKITNKFIFKSWRRKSLTLRAIGYDFVFELENAVSI